MRNRRLALCGLHGHDACVPQARSDDPSWDFAIVIVTLFWLELLVKLIVSFFMYNPYGGKQHTQGGKRTHVPASVFSLCLPCSLTPFVLSPTSFCFTPNPLIVLSAHRKGGATVAPVVVSVVLGQRRGEVSSDLERCQQVTLAAR